MFIKAIKCGEYQHHRGDVGEIPCWDESGTTEIDFDDMCFHCNVSDKTKEKLKAYLISKLGE